jgi:hypothetical protein
MTNIIPAQYILAIKVLLEEVSVETFYAEVLDKDFT